MTDYERVHILKDMKENLEAFDEKREELIEKEKEIKNEMTKDGFDDVLKNLGIF